MIEVRLCMSGLRWWRIDFIWNNTLARSWEFLSIRFWPGGEITHKNFRIIRFSGKMSRLKSDSKTNSILVKHKPCWNPAKEKTVLGEGHRSLGLPWVWAQGHIADSRPSLLLGICFLVTTTLGQHACRRWTSLPLQGVGYNRESLQRGRAEKVKKKKLYTFLGRKVALLKEVLFLFSHF